MTPGPLFSSVCSLRAGRWMHDPACYLTQIEINKELPEQVEVMDQEVLLPEQAA